MHVAQVCFFVMASLFLASCGSSSTTTNVTYAGVNAFADPTVTEVVFCTRSVPTNCVGNACEVVDANGDTVPDVFVAPAACGSLLTCDGAKPVGCGFPTNSSGQVTLSDLPLQFTYEIQAEFRSATGSTLYCGQQTFANQEGLSGLTINVVAGACP